MPTAARILVEAAGFDLAVDIAVFPDVKLLAAQQDGGAVNGNILIGERHPSKTSLAAMADAPTKASARALGELSQFFLDDPPWTAPGGLDADLVAVVPDRIDRVSKRDKESIVSLRQLVFCIFHCVDI